VEVPVKRFLVPAVVLAVGLAGCSDTATKSGPAENTAAESKTRERVVGVSVLTMNNPFFVEMAEAMKDEGRKHGFRVDVVSGDYNVATQKGQIEDFIVRGVDAIILCPCDSKSIGPPIQEANAKGIPVFTADIACLAKDAKVVCHVATDNEGGGRLAAQAVAEMLGGNGKVGILEYPEIESCLLRTQGFHAEIKKTPGVEVVATLSGGADRKKSYDAANDIVQSHPELNGIFAINDPSALGTIAKLKEKGLLGKIKVVGFDAHPEGRKAVKAGDLYATITQDQEKIGRTVIAKMTQYLNGEEVEKQILIPCAIYRKADADKDPSLTKKETEK
jgi:ribose transport system substrate-binding protein